MGSTLAKNRERQPFPVPTTPPNAHRLPRHLSSVSLPPLSFQLTPTVLPPATMVGQVCGVHATPEPIDVPATTTCAALKARCEDRHLALPRHPTLAGLPRLMKAYNFNIVTSGTYAVKRILTAECTNGHGSAARRRSLRASLCSF